MMVAYREEHGGVGGYRIPEVSVALAQLSAIRLGPD